MQSWPLLVSRILEHAVREHGEQQIVTRAVEGDWRCYRYRDLQDQAWRVAQALQRDGIRPGDRIGTLAWNTDRHMEVWYGTMGIGAVCHTINPRLFADQIAYIVNHALDRILFIDATFVPLIRDLRARLGSVERIIVLGSRAGLPQAADLELTAYEDWLDSAPRQIAWPSFPEETAAGLCYTSGTTGNPKGVLYSHRSNVLHALAMNQPDGFALRARDVVLPVVPMFHANAWALIFMAPMAGARLVLPGARLDGASIWELLERERVTMTAAVPTVWLALLQYLQETGKKLDHLRRVYIGGSAVPRTLVERFESDYGVEIIHAWGMTEMSPVGSFSVPIADDDGSPQRRLARKLKQGRAPFTVERKIVDDEDAALPWDGQSRGHLSVRGPAVVQRYFGAQEDACDLAGWFETGDVATIDPRGFMQIVDRSKDVIKSGGEWISSIELENAAVGHAAVAEAAVIGVPSAKWGERPLLIVVVKRGMQVERRELLEYLRDKVAKWWLPEAIEFVAEIPHTATGKINKQMLRNQFRSYCLD